MKKKILCIFTIILTILAGCAKEEKSNIEVSDDEVGIETMEGMKYLVAGNDYGFYFDVYSKSGDKKNTDSKISVNNGNDNLYFMIENAGEDRQIAVQIFIDYIQKYDTIYSVWIMKHPKDKRNKRREDKG